MNSVTLEHLIEVALDATRQEAEDKAAVLANVLGQNRLLGKFSTSQLNGILSDVQTADSLAKLQGELKKRIMRHTEPINDDYSLYEAIQKDITILSASAARAVEQAQTSLQSSLGKNRQASYPAKYLLDLTEALRLELVRHYISLSIQLWLAATRGR